MNFITKGGIVMTCLLLLAIVAISAQTPPPSGNIQRTDLISPSPTAANLARYGETPMTYYTGLPNVSIPIFNVTGNELSVPITLSYNYSGMQPLQKASWVGLGWSLQAGGVITRTMGDKVDDADGFDGPVPSSPSQEYLVDSYERALYDNKPDIYSFNFGNYSGKFILQNGTAYQMPEQRLKIVGGSGGFTITTDDGTQYAFTEREQTTLRPNAGSHFSIPTYTSSWYLTKITNATNTESIKFYYTSDGTVLQRGPQSQSLEEFLGATDGLPGYYVNPGNETPSPPSDIFPTKVTAKRLYSIVSDKYTVDFSASGDVRLDIETESGSSRPLKSIRILSHLGAPVREFTFDYGYFGISSKFLKLVSLTDNGFAGADRFMKHDFQYYNEGGTFGTGSTSFVDKFGYLMGDGIMSMYISNDVYEGGANREPVFASAVNGALRKITYPTGGSTHFSYEPNLFFRGIRYAHFTRYSGAVDYEDYHGGSETVFEVTGDTHAKITLIRTPRDTSEVYTPHNNPIDYELREVYKDFRGRDIVGSVLYSGSVSSSDTNNIKHINIYLVEVKRFAIRAICDEHESEVVANISWIETDTVPDPGALGPGVRLQQLRHDNGFGRTITKKFSYKRPDGFSSGNLLQSTAYDVHELTKYYHSTNYLGGNVWTNRYRVHTSNLAESQGIGLPHYYKYVTEETSSNGESHVSLYEFDYSTGTKDTDLVRKTDYKQVGDTLIPLSIEENTFGEVTPLSAFTGMDIFVKSTNATYEFPLAYTSEYDYNLTVESEAWKYPFSTKQTLYEKNQALITETKSYHNSITHNLTHTKQTNSDGSIILTRYKYPEDYSGISELNAMVAANMLSPVIEEQVWRKNIAGDSVMISGKINEYSGKRLVAIYLMESPEGLTALNNETKSSGKYTSLLSDNVAYKKKIEFTYDASGRVVKQQLTDQPPVSYLWAYPALAGSGSAVTGKVNVIAEVKNGSADAVFHTSFEDETGTQMTSVTGSKAKSGAFTIPVTFSGSYTLTYWKKTGSGAWRLIEQTLNNPTNYVIGTTGDYLDEVRLFPVNAQLTTYTYHFGTGLQTVTDVNNKVTHYEYDEAGRLIAIKDNKGNITQSYQYHVKDQTTSAH
jgi:YD repeat-containing protein